MANTPGNATLHDVAIVGDCAACGGQMVEEVSTEDEKERHVRLRCQDCDATAELRHDFEDGLGGGSWSGVGEPEFAKVSWIDCPRCYGHGYVEDPICDLARAMNGRDTPCANCNATGAVPRIVESDGGEMRCHGCGNSHDGWTKDGEHTVQGPYHAGIIERWACGICGAITEGGRR